MQGKINRGSHTDHPAGRHSVWANQCPHPPSPNFGRLFVKVFALCYQISVCLSVTLVYCGQMVTRIKLKLWHTGRPRPWPHCVRWGPSSPPPKGAQTPNFRPISVVVKWLHGSRCHLVCRPLGMQLGLGPGDCVSWELRSPSPKRGQSPQIFGPYLLWSNGWMHQDATWYGGRP